MWNYTEKVMDFFYNPRNQGVIEDTKEPEVKVVTGEVGSIACGDALKLHLKIDKTTNIILDARFQTFGCASAIASSSALTELIKGMTVEEALKLTNREIAEFLGGLPEEKMHCSVMGQEALEAAISNYLGIPVVVHEEDEGALVCRCYGITEGKIRRYILENDLATAEQVTNYIKAGGACGSCLADIDDLVASVKLEQVQPVPASVNNLGVKVATDIVTSKQQIKSLTTVQKIALIQDVLNEYVKPVLAMDGGDVELYDVEGDRVKVVLKGACGSCSSVTTTLKVAIEATLREHVLPSLEVEAVAS